MRKRFLLLNFNLFYEHRQRPIVAQHITKVFKIIFIHERRAATTTMKKKKYENAAPS